MAAKQSILEQAGLAFEKHGWGATTLAWCMKITRADVEVFGFTDHYKGNTC